MSNLIPISVPGTDRQIMATLVDGKPLVSPRHACDAMGIDWSAQRKRLNSTKWAAVVMIATPSAGGTQETVMVDRRTFTMWLATIEPSRIKNDDARAIVEAFQSEAADALDAYFNEGGVINPRANE